MKDNFIIGALSGMAGAAVMSSLNFLLNLSPRINMKLIFGASELFVPKSLAATLQGSTIGLIAHLVCGSILGLAIFGILEKFGYEYIIFKGTVLGLASWFLLCGILGKTLRLGMQDKFIDNILFILIHIPFGVTTAWLIKRYRYREAAH